MTGVCASAQDQERKVSVCWILPARTDHREIAGYCTLAAYSVSPGDLPHEVTGKLPRYPQVPAAILGRSAVSARHQGQGPGQHLQLDAMQRSLDQSRALGLLALFVDAKDEQAANFYRRYDFVTLPSQPLRLFLPMKAIAELFSWLTRNSTSSPPLSPAAGRRLRLTPNPSLPPFPPSSPSVAGYAFG
ncbi:MAG: GNAT family N-acetyltransferase, partial [Steroidobacteraceae bacterium]|nr:GNAT family N-acetyltransferase [Steroidobacteraceae bacterium]